ncbi:PREDICTED: kinesin-like protein KIN-7O isoform X2 [Ipomoea nil]|uniref:kinesin-like protein KIN-7O isoform X2 n=1 Tax=Ipomoea nil TaxID=35883 RepID=UPI0009014F03|nr:PREDICTED: kinesin-like protein KIN-7O isoform X2 [Ipomoea nil]
MERIHVSVRARPLSPEEAKTSPWRISDNSIFFSNPPSAKFDFDKIFGEECKTVDVYNARTKDIVSAAVQGFNGTVFAYGQTSSGKTHTMRGSSSERGVIPLAVHDLFNFIQEAVDREFLLRMSYMEIYNEEINDLLAPEHWRLQIHESIERGIFVAGLREEIVASPEQVLELMEFGEFHRHTGETNMNLHSSRSHTIFRMIIESREKAEHTPADNSCDAVRVSALNLVDLAGSERAAKTGAEGVRLKEGSHINKSLMTLGTVIKKLSEGAESQGGHVPYRDSKLTRILQPALGGNANTAIICNITLAQVHADETKSSLQFASRALRVTNSVHVNEILTDAALLKRQKKEIEELRAKLQASPSEHLEEEILNLRNTLLKSELERERIALELEGEKKAQAERDKRLQEQAKKIENLSTMVLCSNRDESRDVYKKDKRRDTWCPGNLSRMNSKELCSTVKRDLSAVRPIRAGRDPEPLLPFEELLVPDSVDNSSNQEGDFMNMISEDCCVPDQQALVHVTNRRKGAPRKKSLQTEDRRSLDMQSEYEELLLEFEAHKTVSEIQIDYLTRKIAGVEADLIEKCNDSSMQYNNDTIHLMGNKYLREPEALLVIKQLHEKIRVLEMERSSNQESLDCVVELATEQTISAREKYEEVYQELLGVKEEAKEAKEQLASVQIAEEKNFMSQVLAEVQGMMIEVENSRNLTDSVIPVMDDLLQSYSVISNSVAELKSFLPESSMQIKSIISNQEKICSCLSVKINELEDEKILLHNQNLDLQVQIEQLQKVVHSSENALVEYSEKYEAEKSELLSQIRSLQKEISSLTSSSLAREKESLRKDLEKTKAKLKDTESKLKNAIQEKTKLEGEKACAEREIKILHGQKAILERDINKHDSIVGRRRDSVVDRSSSAFEAKRAKGAAFLAEQTMQEEYKKLEVLAFEMETTIASLEEQLTMANEEKEEAESRAGSLASNAELSDELNVSNAELSVLKEKVLDLTSSLEESKSLHQGLESTINTLSEEKEDLAIQLVDALLAIEEEKAIWLAKERASVEAIEEKTNVYNAEIASLSEALSEVRNELENYREECKLLKESLTNSERCTALEKDCRLSYLTHSHSDFPLASIIKA